MAMRYIGLTELHTGAISKTFIACLITLNPLSTKLLTTTHSAIAMWLSVHLCHCLDCEASVSTGIVCMADLHAMARP